MRAHSRSRRLSPTGPTPLLSSSRALPSGTTQGVVAPALESAGAVVGDDVRLVINPEFLREGSAVSDFHDPDKLVFGTAEGDDRSIAVHHEVYIAVIDDTDPAVVETSRRAAELIKYANNAFLVTKVNLINEIGNVYKEYGVDAYEVAEAVRLDDRIGAKFLRSGLGCGGLVPHWGSASTRTRRHRDSPSHPCSILQHVRDC